MSKHTPGPWKLIGGKNGEWDIEAVGDHDAGGSWAIAQTFGSVGYGEGNVESDANARLIAAAPELLAALRKATQLADIACDWHLEEVEVDGEMVDTRSLRDEFDAAISKATGAA